MQIYQAIDSSTPEEYFEKVEEDLDKYINEFEMSYGQKDNEHPDNQITDEIRAKSRKLLLSILRNAPDTLLAIGKKTHKGTTSSIEKIDLCCLLLGFYEMTHENTPAKVVINEVVSIGKKYGGPASPAFLNATLDKLKKELNK